MTEKTCLKCGTVKVFGDVVPPACPFCGAIYAKVEQAAAKRAQAQRDAHVEVFAERMRAQSLYPTWRANARWCALLGYVIAALVALVAIVSGWRDAAQMLGGLSVALFIVVAAKVGKEAALMAADLSDAAVRLAARRDDG